LSWRFKLREISKVRKNFEGKFGQVVGMQSAGKEDTITLAKYSESPALKRPVQFSTIGTEASHQSQIQNLI